jgi:very-short-patch-repair endonuclease
VLGKFHKPVGGRPQLPSPISPGGPQGVIVLAMAAPAFGVPSWRELAESQADVLSRRQWLLAGLSEDSWQWRLDTGRWSTVFPGVAVTHSGSVTDEQRAWASVLYAGPGAALSGDAALVLAGLRGLEIAAYDVAIPVQRRVRAQPRLRPHRVRKLAGLVHPLRRPPRVRPPRAVLDALSWAAGDRSGEWRLAAAVQQRLVRVSELRAALAEVPCLPRRALVEAVLADVEQGAHAQTELDFLAFLRRCRLPPPDQLQLQVRVGRTRYLDAWWERQRVVAEVDGAHHRFASSWDADTLRANDVVVSRRHDRVMLLRLTGGNLRHDQVTLERQFRAALLG